MAGMQKMTHRGLEHMYLKKKSGGGHAPAPLVLGLWQAEHTRDSGSTHPADQVKTYRFFKSKGWQVCGYQGLL